MKKNVAHCYIDDELCIGCRQCVSLCPMNAISVADGKARIDPAECAECGVCTRSRLCRTRAIRSGNLAWPRTLRALFSNPLAKFKGTQVYGRGTEESKTNDSQNIYPRGTIGVIIELGRPVLGTRLVDAERVVKKFAAHGYHIVDNNPVKSLIDDPKTGAMKPEILQERVISCLVEFVVPESAADELTTMIGELADEVETVFNVCVALQADEEGRPRLQAVFGADIHSIPNVKVNLGLARGVLEAIR
jgi:Pyruvate/2-oxoacid:ferredoxin oxidoreductase delta subunit